ncbi:neuroligin-2 isoform X2 [Harpegnathos saltator]|uniref:neuroligin-2 isoform X2 n=1 Tax=Harpegnathos saltator TaxID=610380 RepID=UPI000948F703|nr:neuroligin-2 isoform X2 [Harpegnathos saltator]
MAARGQHAIAESVVICSLCLLIARSTFAQQPISAGSRYYNRDGVYVPQDAYGYKTIFYKDRRYGLLDPLDRGPTRAPEDRYLYEHSTPRIPLPGILAGWRKDLQGKERPDSKTFRDRDVIVNTNYGQVQGFKVQLYDNPYSLHRPWNPSVDRVTKDVIVFLGIPYALPPVKEGRFKPPRPNRGWQLIQAIDWGPACPQPSEYTGKTKGVEIVDEDCLYLNIFTPSTDAGVASKYAVMFYIHGGEFTYGASNLFPAHILAAFYNVVVVSINYRLGALGFLSTGDENSPGNYGILDQAMALRWVYDNIAFFNGNPESITLFGPGAGAASAGLLMVVPRTRELVSKVIAQSGSALADWAVIMDKYRAQNTSRVYAQMVGCSIESSWKLVQCLKDGRNPFELSNPRFQPHVGMFPWAPVLDINFTIPQDHWYDGWRASDWRFFAETPEESIKAGRYRKDLAYMTGVTTQEAAYIIRNNETLRNNRYVIDSELFDQKVRELVLQYNYTLNPQGVYEAIKYMYTYWPDPMNVTHIRDQYINLLSDFHYVAPNDKMVKLLVEKYVPTYLYVLNTSIESFNLPQWAKVPHDTEHLWLTGAPFMDPEFFPERLKLNRDMWTDSDRNMSHFFMKAYSNFATYGNPTPSQILGLHFDVTRYGQLRYLNINTTLNSSIEINYRQTESAFWSMYLPTVIGYLVPTYPPVTEYWWEPKQPLQIAFWSMSTACLLLLVLSVVCCMLWRNAKSKTKAARMHADNLITTIAGTS